MSEVTVSMPLNITPEMIRAIRINEATACNDTEEMHRRIGWLLCAYELMVHVQTGAYKSPLQEAKP